MQYVGLVGGTITTLGGVPQIYKMHLTKQAGDLSWGMLFMWTLGLIMTLIYSVNAKQFAVYVPTTLSLMMTLVMMWLKWRYRIPKLYSPV
jgi:uncharacterized protein with PQ loop repeat